MSIDLYQNGHLMEDQDPHLHHNKCWTFIVTHCLEGISEVLHICTSIDVRSWAISVILDFKDKTRYAPYVSLRSQISHIATNKGNIKRQCIDIKRN